jgi:hypothetical protein
VDDVVREAGMLRLLLEQLFQDRRRLELLRVRLVAWQGRLVDGKRVECGGFTILRSYARTRVRWSTVSWSLNSSAAASM